jgi:predicted RNA-binding protein with PUA-like domain
VTLAEIKADPAFKGWDFLRIGRLSVVPTPAEIWDRIVKMAEEKP